LPPPDTAFDRAWALHLIQRALEIVGREFHAAGSGREYEVLKPWLGSDAERLDVAGAAGALGSSEGAVRVAIHRLRRRFREVVTEEIGRTVEGPEEVAAELHHLIEALAR
jgi:RNA polymerase sigma-70 factor (ECF subfamily)